MPARGPPQPAIGEEPPRGPLSPPATRHWIHTLSMCVTQCIDLVNALDPERSRTPALAFVTTIPFSRSDGPGIREVPKGGNPAAWPNTPLPTSGDVRVNCRPGWRPAPAGEQRCTLTVGGLSVNSSGHAPEPEHRCPRRVRIGSNQPSKLVPGLRRASTSAVTAARTSCGVTPLPGRTTST